MQTRALRSHCGVATRVALVLSALVIGPYVLAAPALAQPSGNPAMALHGSELAVRAGLLLGGEITPKSHLIGKTSTSYSLLAEISYLSRQHLALGSYLAFASAPYRQYLYEAAVRRGNFSIVSAGLTGKGCWAIGDRAAIRLGLMLGFNRTWLKAEGPGRPTYDRTGLGLNAGLTGEMVVPVSGRLALSAQLAFLAQPGGRLDPKDGENAPVFGFVPQFVTLLGPSIYF